MDTDTETQKVHYPIETPSLESVIKLRMEEKGLTKERLAVMLGTSLAWVNDFFMGKRGAFVQHCETYKAEVGYRWEYSAGMLKRD